MYTIQWFLVQIKYIIQGRIQKFWLGGRESRRHWGWSLGRGEKIGFCISNGDFWCILGAVFYSSDARFTHKKQRFGREIGAKFTNWGFWAPVVLKRQTIRETPWWKICFVFSLPSDVMRFAYSVTSIDLQAEHIKPLNWLKAGVAYHRYWGTVSWIP